MIKSQIILRSGSKEFAIEVVDLNTSLELTIQIGPSIKGMHMSYKDEEFSVKAESLGNETLSYNYQFDRACFLLV